MGFDAAIVKAHLEKCFTEFDSVAGRSTHAPVSRGYLSIGSSIRADLALNVRCNLPPSRCRSLAFNTFGHASSLLCARRQEGDHRSIKVDIRSMPNSTPQHIMAFLRRRQTDELRNEASFVEFAASVWERKGRGSVPHQLLEHRFPFWQATGWHFPAKARRVYGSTVAEQFVGTRLPQLRLLSSTNAQAPRVHRHVLTGFELQWV